MNTETLIDLRSEIEMTKERFHRMLVTIPEEALRLPSKCAKWTNGEVLYRMTLAPLIVRSILKRNFGNMSQPRLPKLVTGPLIEWGSERRIRSAVRKLTLLALAKDYEYNCALLVEILDRFVDEDFATTVMIPEPEKLLLPPWVTVEQLLHYVKDHFNLYRRLIQVDK